MFCILSHYGPKKRQSPTLMWSQYADLIPPKRIQFGHISKNIGPDGKPITGGGTRVTITGKSDEEKAVWKTLGEGNEDMVEWAVISAALHVLDDEIVKAAEAAGIRIGVMPGAPKANTNPTSPPPPDNMPRLQLHPTGHRPDKPPPAIQGPPVIPNSKGPPQKLNGIDPRLKQPMSQQHQQQPQPKLSASFSAQQQQQISPVQQAQQFQQVQNTSAANQGLQGDRQRFLSSLSKKGPPTPFQPPQPQQYPFPDALQQRGIPPNGVGMRSPPSMNGSHDAIKSSPLHSSGNRPPPSQQIPYPAYNQTPPPPPQFRNGHPYHQQSAYNPGLPRLMTQGMPGSSDPPPRSAPPVSDALRSRSPIPLPIPGAGSSLPDLRLSPPTDTDGNGIGSGTGFNPSYRRPSNRPPSDPSHYYANGSGLARQNGHNPPQAQAAPYAQIQPVPQSPRRDRAPFSSSQQQQQQQQGLRSPYNPSMPPGRSPPRPQELKEEDTVDSVAFMLGTAALNDAVTVSSEDSKAGKQPMKDFQPPKERERSRVGRLLKNR